MTTIFLQHDACLSVAVKLHAWLSLITKQVHNSISSRNK